MIRGTTFPLTFEIPGATLTDYTDIHVTLDQNGLKLDFTPTVVDNTHLRVELTQEQSLKLKAQPAVYQCKAQANWMYDGYRCATETSLFDVSEQLLDEVIE